MIDWKNNGQGVDIMKRILPFILILIIAGSLANCVFLPGNESSGSSDIGHEDVETTDNGQTETPPPQQNDPEPSPGIHTVNTQKPEETPAATIEPDPGPEQEETVEIRISFAGDCTIGTDEAFTYVNSFPDRYERVGGDDSYFFRGVKPIFENDDLTLVNLETTFTREKKKAEKKFRFKGDPSYVNILKEGSIEAVNISNNHIYDYLKKGFQDTLATLEQAGILYSGEGHIAYYEQKGITIGSIGYQGWSTGIKDSLKNDILEARQKADIVIVSFIGA